MSAVEVRNVIKRFGANLVLDDISVTFPSGVMTAIIGRSGSGKSTLLRCLNGLERVDSGEIEIGGHKLTYESKTLRSLRRNIGIVFQGYNLFPHLTAERNITLALTVVQEKNREEARDIATRVLREVGLEEKRAAYPDQLSGGQQQRVAIARALALDPKVILFDEVTSALDPELTGEVLRVMATLSERGITMILVTHEMNFAKQAAKKLVFMHEGKIREEGDPVRLFEKPTTPELTQFLKSVI
jgi:polar amino acid transport system ATP-binding protein